MQLGRSLDLRVTAEGMENEDRLVLLRSMGCGSFQGYYYSRPLPVADVRKLSDLRALPQVNVA